MHSVLVVLIWTVFLFQDLIQANSLILHGPNVIKKGDRLDLRCISDDVPSGKTVEFAINGETYTSLVWYIGGCFSALSKSKCEPNICQCSEDGKTYFLRIDSTKYKDLMTVSCLMRFSSQRKTSLLKVTILDMEGPHITSSKPFPLKPGTTVNIVCNIFTSVRSTTLDWNCLKYSSVIRELKNSTTHVSVLAVIVERKLYGKNCTCIARWKNFSSDVSVIFDINFSPSIELDSVRECNGSEPQTVTCNVEEDLTDYGFKIWKHYQNGYFIRELAGNNSKNQSNLSIPCSYINSGEYMCRAWTIHRNKTYLANKTISFIVYAPPQITEARMIKTKNTILYARFLSYSEPTSAKWYRDGHRITEIDSLNMTFLFENISYSLHQRIVHVPGYTSNLTLLHALPGAYSVLLENDFGITKHDFLLTTDASFTKSFSLQTVLWILTALIVLILSTVITTALTRRQRFHNFKNSFSSSQTTDRSRSIYFAAPMSEINEHAYYSTNPPYVDVADYQSSRIYSDINESDKTSEGDATDNESLQINAEYMEVI